MKKVILICLVFAGCKNQPTLTEQAENFLKSELKDPKSYERISSTIVDTVTKSAWLKEMIAYDSTELARQLRRNNIDSLSDVVAGYTKEENFQTDSLRKEAAKIYSSSIDKNKKELSTLKTDSILYINLHLVYRAKNGFGALDKGEKNIEYWTGDKSFLYAK